MTLLDSQKHKLRHYFPRQFMPRNVLLKIRRGPFYLILPIFLFSWVIKMSSFPKLPQITVQHLGYVSHSVRVGNINNYVTLSRQKSRFAPEPLGQRLLYLALKGSICSKRFVMSWLRSVSKWQLFRSRNRRTLELQDPCIRAAGSVSIPMASLPGHPS